MNVGPSPTLARTKLALTLHSCTLHVLRIRSHTLSDRAYSYTTAWWRRARNCLYDR